MPHPHAHMEPHVVLAELAKSEIARQRERAASGKRIQWDVIDEVIDKMIDAMPKDARLPERSPTKTLYDRTGKNLGEMGNG